MTLEEFFTGAAAGCQMPGCTHPHESVVMSPACHKGSPTFVEVDAKARTIKITCATCNKAVATVACPFVN
jgi:hypothetical protein